VLKILALHRLDVKGCMKSAITPTENNRRTKTDRLTVIGRRHLESEANTWEQFVASMKRFLQGA
jgi:hypothetical protein